MKFCPSRATCTAFLVKFVLPRPNLFWESSKQCFWLNQLRSCARLRRPMMAFCNQEAGVRRQVPAESTASSFLPPVPALLFCVSFAVNDFPLPVATFIVITQVPKALSQRFPAPARNASFLPEPEVLLWFFVAIKALAPHSTAFAKVLFSALPLKQLFAVVLES